MNHMKLDSDDMVKLLKIMGDKTRYTILSAISQRKYCVCQLQELFNASQPAISQHLRKLRDAGLVQEEKHGQWVYYSLNKESKYYEAMGTILQLAPLPEEQVKKLEKIHLQLGC